MDRLTRYIETYFTGDVVLDWCRVITHVAGVCWEVAAIKLPTTSGNETIRSGRIIAVVTQQAIAKSTHTFEETHRRP